MTIKIILFNLLVLFLSGSNLEHLNAQWQSVGSQNFTTGASENQSLAIHNGAPYVAFKDFSNGLKTTVMKFDGTNWINVGFAGLSSGLAEKQSLAIATSGIPFVAYSDYANNEKVTVRKYNGTHWVTVGGTGITTNHQSYDIDLVLDNSNVPYVTYIETGGVGLVVKKFDGSNWIDIGHNLPNLLYTRLAFDFNNGLYICGADAAGRAVVYKFNGSNWSMVGFSALSVGQAWYISFAIDANSSLYVAYNDVPFANKLTVMKYNGSSWSSLGNPGFTSNQVFSPTIKIDNNNVPYVAYKAGSNMDVIKYVGNTWVNVGQSGFVPANVSTIDFELDIIGIPYIAYEDNSTNKTSVMKYTMPSSIGNVELAETIFKISPNPATEYTIINYDLPDNTTEASLIIYNLNGTQLKKYPISKTLGHLQISTQGLPSGTYYYSVQTNTGQTQSKKMVIVK